MTPSDLQALLRRVEEASGPDRELDAELAFRFKSGFVRGRSDDAAYAPPYTASLDAALALTERVLPGWTIAHLSQQDDKSWFAELREGYLTSYNRVAMSEARIRPPTSPLALLAATLRALIATNEGSGG